jgi:hypothetical protein
LKGIATETVFDPSSSTGLESPWSPPANSSAAAGPKTETPRSPRYVLPKDLDAAIKHLDRQQLDRLGGKVFAHDKSQRNAEAVSPALPQGKLNAV